MSDGQAGGAAVPVTNDGFRLTPVGAVMLVISIIIGIFYFTSPVPGPRVGRTLSTLGPSRPGSPGGGAPGTVGG